MRTRLASLATTVVGSDPQPTWLVDRAGLARGVPRVRRRDLWRVPEDVLEEAQDDATVVAIWEMELAGIDIVTDGEIRRESYSNRFATALDGVDTERPGVIRNRLGQETVVPGPFTPSQQVQDEFYRDAEQLAMDCADAVNAEARELEAAGADVIQRDEPWLRNDPDAAAR